MTIILIAIIVLIGFTLERALNRTSVRTTVLPKLGQIYDRKMVFLAIATIVGPLVVYGYVAAAPFHMWDSMVFYITDAKSIASGWLYSDFAAESFSTKSDYFSEIMDSLSVFVARDTYIARLGRLIGLVAISTMLWGYFRSTGIEPKWAILGISCFLLTPELTLTGVSGKPDGLITATELSAAILLLIALNSQNLATRLPILAVSVFLASVALSTRMSGIYLVAITGLVFIFTLINSPLSWSNKLIYAGLVAIPCLATCLLFFVNWINVGNPFFWLKAPWPFEGGLFIYDPKIWKTFINLEVFPPLLNELYLIFHQALGIEILNPFLDQIIGTPIFPRLADNASLGWLSPAMLIFFFTPFLIASDRRFLWITLLFFGWYGLWASGLHYSRLFIAGSSLGVLALVSAASIDLKSATWWLNQTRNLARLTLLAIPLCFLPLHIYLATTRPHDLLSLASPAARYHAKVSYLTQYMESGGIPRVTLPSFRDSQNISDILNTYRRPYVITNYTRAINILFPIGRFTEFQGSDNTINSDCFLLNKALTTHAQSSYLNEFFPNIKFGNNDWTLSCR